MKKKKKKKWQIRDLIDLEYFLYMDEDADDGAVIRRDREIYLKEVVPVLEKDDSPGTASRKTIIRLWLDGRRRVVDDAPGKETVLPGSLFDDIIRLLTVLFLVTGVTTGTGLAFTLLDYNGTTPVNVSTYFGVFVLFQILLVCALLSFSLLRNRIRSLRRISLLQPILGMLLVRMFRKIAAHATKALSADRRNRLAEIEGILKGKKRIYGSVFYWPVFIIAQITGIGFNLGVLAGSILKVVSLDIAFGWQSTIQFSSKAVYTFVKTVSLPWSWIVSPSLAHPTLLQIEGSRMVLKDGIYHLATPDLVSWWPFLLLAVFFYGMIPRIILFGVGIMVRNRATGKVGFNHAACDRLLRRLNTPVLETEGRTVANDEAPDPTEAEPGTAGLRIVEKNALHGYDAIVLVPDDIYQPGTSEALHVLLEKRLGMILKREIKITLDVDEDKKMLADLAAGHPLKGQVRIVVLQEAWQPPISETLLYFGKLRELLGAEVQILIFLIGKPSPETIFTSAGLSDWKVWKQAIQMLGDPLIEIHGLRNS